MNPTAVMQHRKAPKTKITIHLLKSCDSCFKTREKSELHHFLQPLAISPFLYQVFDGGSEFKTKHNPGKGAHVHGLQVLVFLIKQPQILGAISLKIDKEITCTEPNVQTNSNQ